MGRGSRAALLLMGFSLATSAWAQAPVRPSDAPAPIHGPVGESGMLGAAPYRIDIPAGWRGGLVVLFHGYEVTGEPRANPYRALPGSEQFLERGYAVIQSGYSRQGWAVAEARADTRALRARFEQRFGRPTRVYAAGFSMGGHLALATVEQESQRYDGALSLCGVNMPAATLFDLAVTHLAAARALFPEAVPDLAAAGSPAMLPDGLLEAALAADPESAEQLARWIGIRTGNLPSTLWLYYAVIREQTGRAGGLPGGNPSVAYAGFGDDPAFNRRVPRYRAARAAEPYVQTHATLTGRLRDPVIILSNAYDNLVANSTTSIYPAMVRRAAQTRRLTVLPPAGEGHCNFEPDQIGAAFDRLTRQVEAAPQNR